MRLIHIVAFAAMVFAVAQDVHAQSQRLKNVAGYCGVVEKHIVALANTEVSANDDLAKFASDQPGADAKRFTEARDLLSSVTVSLKDKEIEWYHLGCTQILYRTASNR